MKIKYVAPVLAFLMFMSICNHLSAKEPCKDDNPCKEIFGVYYNSCSTDGPRFKLCQKGYYASCVGDPIASMNLICKPDPPPGVPKRNMMKPIFYVLELKAAERIVRDALHGVFLKNYNEVNDDHLNRLKEELKSIKADLKKEILEELKQDNNN